MDVAVSNRLSIKGNYVLDLGYNGGVLFTTATSKAYRLDTLSTEKINIDIDWALSNAPRNTSFRVFRAKSIRLNNFVLHEPIVEFTTATSGPLSNGNYLGLLGNEALERFDVMIDLANAVLYLRPNSEYKKRVLFKTTGFGFVDRTDICDGWVVTAVFSGSGQANASLMHGDIVTHINGKSVKKNEDEAQKILRDVTGKPIAITVQRKTETLSFNLLVKEELR